MMQQCNQTLTLEMPHLINSEDLLLHVHTLPHLYRVTENSSSYLDRPPGAALDFFSFYKMILATGWKKREKKEKKKKAKMNS